MITPAEAFTALLKILCVAPVGLVFAWYIFGGA